ncbi:MAG: hypothetical protein H6608_00385 [Flavobacteriales bacterium]|nr:hypothetical protein [Flavobacteriales bacterium]
MLFLITSSVIMTAKFARSITIIILVVSNLSSLAQLPLQQVGLLCLFGQNPDGNERIVKFIETHHLIEMDGSQVTPENPIGYKTENGSIKTMYFLHYYEIPDYLRRRNGLSYSYKSLARFDDQSLALPHKIKEEQVVYKNSRNGVSYTNTYVWNGRKRKRKKDFLLSSVEVHIENPRSVIPDSCSQCFEAPKPYCYEGDCLMCAINRPVNDVLKELRRNYSLPFHEKISNTGPYYGSLTSGLNIFYEKDSLVSKIEISPYSFKGKFPLNLTSGMKCSELPKHLGVYDPTPDYGLFYYFYYGNAKLLVTCDLTNREIDKITLSRDYNARLPSCPPISPLPLPNYGCLWGDCENGYGRARYNGDDHFFWEYEGGFQKGVFHGDGCEIHGDRYTFNHYENGYIKRPLIDTLCVDDECAFPPENYDPSKKVVVNEKKEPEIFIPSEYKLVRREQEYLHLMKGVSILENKLAGSGYSMESVDHALWDYNPYREWHTYSFKCKKNQECMLKILSPMHCDLLEYYLEFPDGRKTKHVERLNFVGSYGNPLVSAEEGKYIFHYRIISYNRNIPIGFALFKR